MSDEELQESLERHFLIGNAFLTTAQFGEHRDRGSCEQCDEIAAFTARTARQPAYSGTPFASGI